MYVCICNAITEQQIRDIAKTGIRDLWTLQQELGVAAGCGTCMDSAMQVLNECHPVAEMAPQAPCSQPRLFRPVTAEGMGR